MKQTPVEEIIKDITVNALEDTQAVDLSVYDVRKVSNVTDYMVICSGKSNRHIKSLATNVLEKVKAAGYKPLSIEGQDSREWVLVDLGEVVVHIMLPTARHFYDLESLWQTR
jgi:ribosome-associated protein